MKRRLRLFYAAGAGDVPGTYRCWKRSEADQREVAHTYSGQFFDVCREIDAEALVISCHSSMGTSFLRDGQFVIRNRPVPFAAARCGALFHLGRMYYGLWLTCCALRHRADVAVVADGTHWFMLWCMAVLGIRVVPSMHRALWPAQCRPTGRMMPLVHRLDGLFWRYAAWRTIVVSPECKRQIHAVAQTVRGDITVVKAQYDPAHFAAIPPPPVSRQPFHIMYAGRMESSKGVWTLLWIATELERRQPGRFTWTMCGGGSQVSPLRTTVQEQHLQQIVNISGRLNQADMHSAYSRAHAVIVPTTRRCIEGLNKVAVEAVLAGRPVIASMYAHAGEVLGDAAMQVARDDCEHYCRAIEHLAGDGAVYAQQRAACAAVAAQFYDARHGWAAALINILSQLQGQQRVHVRAQASSSS